METNRRRLACIFLAIGVLCLAGCAAGDVRFAEDSPAGFWAGLWHGLILVIAFVISLFNDAVHVYEANNTGNLYNLGFVLGAAAALRGGLCGFSRKKKRKDRHDHDKLEKKIKVAIRTWVEEKGEKDPEWKEIAEKVEEKVKREIRKWASNEEE